MHRDTRRKFKVNTERGGTLQRWLKELSPQLSKVKTQPQSITR